MAEATFTDVWLIAATLAGPVLAVQAQKFIERATERRRRKLHIFYTLMATRATHLAPERVQVLNLIDMEFRPRLFGYQSKKDKAVIAAWKLLLDELNHLLENEQDRSSVMAWNRRCDDLAEDLLFAISQALGFAFSKVDLRRGAYYPRGHFELEQAQRQILLNAQKLLAGDAALPMRVVEFPVSHEAVEAQIDLQKRFSEALSGGALHVAVTQKSG